MTPSRWRPHRPAWWSKNATRGLVAVVFLLGVIATLAVSLQGRIGQLEDQRERDAAAAELQVRVNTILCRQNDKLAAYLTDLTREGGIKTARRATDCVALADRAKLQPLPGPAGKPGARGRVGAAGANGVGTPGVKGLTGNQGKSIVGPAGPAGKDGVSSTVPGPRGPAGPTGATGSTGPTGLTGPRGAQGEQGDDSNVPGPTGATGATGAQGPQGEPGTCPGPCIP